MSDTRTALSFRIARRAGHKPQLASEPEQVQDSVGAAEEFFAPPEIAGGVGASFPVVRLDPGRLQTAQRQVLAAHIGNACGNRQVQRWIQDRRPRPASPQPAGLTLHRPATPVPAAHVQRFISSEHVSLGDITGDVIPAGTLFPDSPELTYGEIVALSGDLYGSFEHLASPNYIRKDGGVDSSPGGRQRKIDELKELKSLLAVEAQLIAQHREQAAQTGQSPHGYVPEGIDTGYATDPSSGVEVRGYELATEGRYGALALDNFKHFSEGGENLTEWKAGHRQAMIDAFLAGFQGNKQPGFFMALARNAAADHYLTDAFSAGHMRVPRRCADQYYRRLMAGVGDGAVEALVNALPERIYFRIPLSALEDYLPDWMPDVDLPDIEVDIPLPLQGWARDLAGPLADEIRPFMEEPVGQVLGGLVSKWLHDKDNERGLCVSNKAGERWQAFGDAFLDQPETRTECNGTTTNRAEAQKAVLADRDEVRRMFAAGQAAAAQDAYTGGISPVIYFAFDQPRAEGDSGAIDGAGQQSLDTLAAYLQTVDGLTISFRGWADSRGSQQYNVGLAGRRISAVRAYLAARGVPAGILGSEDPAGEPLAPTSAANHHLFRRVDILIEGTPTRKPIDRADNALPTDVRTPAEVDGPYGAEEFLPQMASNNPVLDPYEWCDITNPALKTEISQLGRSMLSDLLNGKATQFIYKHLSDFGPYHVDVDLPIVGRHRLEIPRIPVPHLLSEAVKPYIEGAVNRVVTDSVFSGLMDGACGLASAAPEVPSADQCGQGP